MAEPLAHILLDAGADLTEAFEIQQVDDGVTFIFNQTACEEIIAKHNLPPLSTETGAALIQFLLQSTSNGFAPGKFQLAFFLECVYDTPVSGKA